MATSREGPAGRTARLCTRCRELELLGTGDFHFLDFEDEWPALNGLKQFTATGCQFCEMIYSSIISSPEPHPAPGPVSIVIRPAYTDPRGQLYALRIFMGEPAAMSGVRLNRPTSSKANDLVRGTFLLCTQSSEVTNMFSAPTTQVLSERNVDFIQKYIPRVAESALSTDRVALELPTRLLDLADFQCGRAKLVLSTEIPRTDDNRYAALSYCWGSGEVAKSQSITTFSNQEDRKAGFEIKDLSAVIQDAIEVCSRIGIRYLWVDALCILQAGPSPSGNSDKEAAKEDWNRESDHLWATFRGSCVTICAASSTSCQDSFLQDRQMQPGLVIKLRTAESGESSASSTSSPESPAYEIIPWATEALERDALRQDQPFQPIILNSRWYSRGWVHQEISFSPCLLVFGTNMLCMRCDDLLDWENGKRGEGSGWRLRSIDYWALKSDPFRQFRFDVKALYNKQITIEKDRLPAIAGLANQVANLTKSQYLAGLWRKNLANELIYSVEPRRGAMPFDERLRELSAPQSEARPSWSWAGHRSNFKNRPGEKEVSWLQTHDDGWSLDCVVVDAVAEADGGSPFGVIKHAHLLLSCRVIALEELLRGKPSAVDPSKIWRESYSEDLKGLKTCWDTCNDAAPVDCTANILLICTSRKASAWAKDGMETAGLIIYPAQDGGYYRIGMWKKDTPYPGKVRSCVDDHLWWETRTIKLL